MLEQTVRIGSRSLATRAWLRPTGPRVLLVHGHGTNLESWGSLVPRLRDWCSVVAFDRRGHGLSSDADSFTATDLASDIAAVATAYEFDAPIVIGHSAGGWDSLTYATKARPYAVVCLDQAIASDDPVWRDSLTPHDEQPDPCYTEAEWAQRMARGEAEVGARAWRETYGPMNRRGAVQNSDGLIYYRPDHRIRHRIQAGWASFGDREPYDDITCRTVVVLARHNVGPIHDALRSLVSRRRLEHIAADCGHNIHIEQP